MKEKINRKTKIFFSPFLFFKSSLYSIMSFEEISFFALCIDHGANSDNGR